MTSGLGATSAKPTKAFILNEDTGDVVVECLFNPTEYSLAKTNNWSTGTQSGGGKNQTLGKNIPLVHFTGGGASTLTVSLLFDTYTMSPPVDVRTYTDKVVNLMKVDPKYKDQKSGSSRPPRVSFRWGNWWSFKAGISSLNQKFTLFTSTGMPVRATLEVTFTEVEDQDKQWPTNPTSFAEAQKVHVVGPGETIDSIAFQEYGDAKQWRAIADFNELDNPMRLRPGQQLAIPPGP